MRVELGDVVGRDVRVLIGHDRGLAVRQALRLDELDGQSEPIQVIVPPSVSTLTPSFVQGLFAASVHSLGEPKFYAHYAFDRQGIVNDIKAGVDRVLTSRRLAGAV